MNCCLAISERYYQLPFDADFFDSETAVDIQKQQ
jgi:hypothetical protein